MNSTEKQETKSAALSFHECLRLPRPNDHNPDCVLCREQQNPSFVTFEDAVSFIALECETPVKTLCRAHTALVRGWQVIDSEENAEEKSE
jgi:hypothetical protein